MAWQVGQQIGQYEITSQLGAGGMATVYKAYHKQLDRYVAIKVMHQNFQNDEGFVTRFTREAQIIAKLEHPHIVPIYDYATYDEQPYIVMKYIEGETLKERLFRGLLSVEDITRVMNAIASALDYAHVKGVLHRDVKPSNIVLEKDGTPFLTDFGLARITKVGQSTLSADMMLGTPHYISPEQARGQKELDGRTDVYSFGVVLYELFVGRVPFNADSYYSIINDHINTPVPNPTEVNPEIPTNISQVLIKTMAKRPNQRYDNATDAMTDLKVAIAQARLSRLSEDRGSIADVSLSRIRQELEDHVTVNDPIVPSTTPIGGIAKQTPTGVRTATVLQTTEEPQDTHKIWMYGGLGVFIVVFLLSIFVVLGAIDSFTQLAQIIASLRPDPNVAFTAQALGTLPNIMQFENIGVSIDETSNNIPIYTVPSLTVSEAEALVKDNPDTDIPYLILASAYWKDGKADKAHTAVANGLDKSTSKEVFLLSAAKVAEEYEDALAEASYLLFVASSIQDLPAISQQLREYMGENLYNLAPSLKDETINSVVEGILSTDIVSRIELRQISTTPTALLLLARMNIVDNNLVVANQILNRIPENIGLDQETELVTAELKLQQNKTEEALDILNNLVEDSDVPEWIKTRAEELLGENS